MSASHKVKADGSIKWYFYHVATRTPLKQEPGSPAFEREAQRAVARPDAPVAKVTLSTICDDFEKSPEHRGRELSTRLQRERLLKDIRFRWAEYEPSHLSNRKFRTEVMKWRNELAATPAAADRAVQVVQRVMSWAYDYGIIEYNHTLKIARLSEKRPREGKIVTTEQEAALLACGTPADKRLYAIAKYTTVRETDICMLRWRNMDADGWIEWLHSKTKNTTKAISFYPTFALPPLKEAIDEMPRTSEFIVVTDRMRPLKTGTLKNRWKNWLIKAAALHPDLDFSDIHFHDIRRTGIQELLEAGATNGEAASISGHRVAESTDGSFETYATRSRRLALAGYRKWAIAKAIEASDKKVVQLFG